MEKLIELLNEYDGKNHWWDYDEEYLTSKEFYEENWDLEIISKKFWFIKWLVENDKIRDLDKLEYVYWIEMVRHWTEELYTAYSLYENLLMLLSISSSPIEDLISYLK